MSRNPSPKSAGAGQLRRLGRIATLALCCLVLAAPATQAQNAGGIGGFFQNLFNFGRPPPPPPQQPLRERAHKARKRTQDYVSSTATRAPGTPGGAALVKPTFIVTVLGDSLAILAGQGLSDAFATKPEVGVNSLARDVSGLTRDDYYDWPKAARDLVAAKGKIDLVVVMMGINDLQPLTENGETFDPLSEKWREAYGRRVEATLAPLHDAHIPVLWVGLPPMHDEPLNTQVAALNEIYRDHVGKGGETYVDIWDAFSDASGGFAAFGPDAEGQNAKLRNGAGGIYFTKVGARKVAQLLEADIRREFDKSHPQDAKAALPPDVEKEASAINAEILRMREADTKAAGAALPAAKPSAGPIVSLTALPSAKGGALVDAAQAATFRTLEQPDRPSPAGAPAGRADNFAWPGSQGPDAAR